MTATESLLRERVEPSAFTLSVIDDIDRFASLRTEWKDLLRSSSANSPFLSWEWLPAWWKHLNGGRTLQKAIKAAHNFAERPKGWLVLMGGFG